MEYVDGVSSSLPRDGDRLPASARGCAPVPDLARVCMAVTLFNKARGWVCQGVGVHGSHAVQ